MADIDYITSQEAAERLGYTRQHIGRLIRRGSLVGRKLGRDWMVEPESIERYQAARENFRLPLETVALRRGGE